MRVDSADLGRVISVITQKCRVVLLCLRFPVYFHLIELPLA